MSKDMLGSLVGKTVQINRSGPDSFTGKVLSVSSDFLVLLTEEDGVVYVRNQHIKSISENVKQGLQMNLETMGLLETLEYQTEESFESLVSNLQYQWVRINRSGPEKLEGVLEGFNGDFLTLVLNEEIVRLSMYHIKSISYGVKPEKTENGMEESSSSSENYR